MSTRFQLPDATIYDFGHEFLVVCPRCLHKAVVQNRGHTDPRQRSIIVSCGNCGYNKAWQQKSPAIVLGADTCTYAPGELSIGGAVDWFFHLPLWLQTPCCGHVLWAYNREHLAFVEDFVQARLRENTKGEYGWHNQSLRNRLPEWIKQSGNRACILKCIAKMEQKALA